MYSFQHDYFMKYKTFFPTISHDKIMYNIFKNDFSKLTTTKENPPNWNFSFDRFANIGGKLENPSSMDNITNMLWEYPI